MTTIAGDYSKATGNKDGPAQNATFSSDFELAVVADRCILLVVDHGSQSIRQIDLKQADCAGSSQSGQIFGINFCFFKFMLLYKYAHKFTFIKLFADSIY